MSKFVDDTTEFTIRGNLHIKIFPDTRAMFRSVCIKRGISMQEAIESFIQKCIMQDASAMSMLENIVKERHEARRNNQITIDKKYIFDLIELDSPLK